MTQHETVPTSSNAKQQAGTPAPKLGSDDTESPADEARSRAADVRLVIADDSESLKTRSVIKHVSEGSVSKSPLPTENGDCATPPRKHGAKKQKASRSRRRPLPKSDTKTKELSGAEWRAARTKSTMRISPEVQRKIQVRSATEALEQQIVVEIALRQFFGMKPLSADMKRDARAQAVWAAMSAESVA